MILHKADYGVKKGIPTTLIAASSFDDIIAITVFSVFLSIGINSAPVPASEDPLIETEAEVDVEAASGLRMLAGSSDEPKPIWWEIGFNVVQFILGQPQTSAGQSAFSSRRLDYAESRSSTGYGSADR